MVGSPGSILSRMRCQSCSDVRAGEAGRARMRGAAKLSSMAQAGAVSAWIRGEGIREGLPGSHWAHQDLGTD